MYHLKHRVYLRINVIYFLIEIRGEEIAHGEFHLLARYHLRGYRHLHTVAHMYLAALGFLLSRHKGEEGRLPRAVLTHHRHLHPAAQGEVYLLEDRLVVPIFERHFFEAYNAFFSCH